MKIAFTRMTACLGIFIGAIAPPGLSQTVGNGTVITPSSIVIGPSAGQREFSASSSFADNPASSPTGSGEFATRHYSRGESSGIGGSFIGTGSPTSESSPAVIVNPAPITNTAQFRLPTLDSSYGSITATPALKVYTPAIPLIPRLGTLSNPFDPVSFERESRSFDLDDLPSFNSSPSFMEKSQFNQFGKHW